MSKRTVLFGILLLAIAASPALALSLCDYTQPVTSVTTFTIQGSFRYFDDEFRDERGNILALSLSGDFLRYYDSANFGYSLGGSASFSRTNGEQNLVGNASVNFRFYAPEMPLFAFGQVSSLWQEFTPTVAAVLGVGYGRLRDVTPLVKAMRISDRLLGEKFITKALPDDTLMAVATEIGRRPEYASLDELVAKIAALVDGAGVVQGKLSPVAVLRIREVLEAVGDQRLCGFAVRAGIGHTLIDPTGVLGFVLFGSGEYALPISVDTQIHIRAEGTASPGFTSYTVHGMASLIHRLGPTTTFTGRLTIFRSLPEGGSLRESQALDASLQFSLSGGWAVTVTVGVLNRTGFEEPRLDLTVSAGLSGF